MSYLPSSLSVVSFTSLFFALTALAVGCQTSSASSSSPPQEAKQDMEGAHRGDHFIDPKRFVSSWNAPERDAWQKPEEILAAMNVQPGSTVVDLGAGTGYLIDELSAAVGSEGTVIAADIEPAMLAFLEDAARKEGWTNVRTHASRPDDPQLPPSSVDAIVALNVWHHVGDREDYAAKLREALRPGGVFVIVDFLAEETDGFGPPLKMRLSAERVIEELQAGGLAASVVEETLPRHYIVRGVKSSE